MNQRVVDMVGPITILLGLILGLAGGGVLYAWEAGNREQFVGEEPAGTPTPAEGGGPAAVAPNSPEAMKQLFVSLQCDACHPAGKLGVGPDITRGSLQKYKTDEPIIEIVRKGRGIMPGYEADVVTDARLKDLIAYLRSVDEVGTGTAAATTPAAGGTPAAAPAGGTNVAAGKEVFSRLCNACHPGGKKGAGPDVSGPALQGKYPTDEALADVIRKGRGGMPPFGSGALSDAQLQDVTAYMRSIQ